LTLVTLILNPDYFYHANRYYEQANGKATSALFADIFLQYIEHNIIIPIINKYNILYYCRYVDDILILYNEEKSNIISILFEVNSIFPSLDFTCEMEDNNSLNFLDITIKKTNNHGLVFNMFRKPSATDTITNFRSNHPPEHKSLAVKYLTDRVQNYPLQKESKEKEWLIIRHILNSNVYPQNFINKTRNPSGKQTVETKPKENWITFTYVGNETRLITKFFKNNTNLKIAYKVNNTIEKKLFLETNHIF
jgi:hypothetical protein